MVDGPGKVTIGQVSFNEKDISSYSVEYKNNQKINCVFLKNGTKLTFPEQNADENVRRTVRGGKTNGETSYNFFGIQGLSIEGSKQNDHYYLNNCDNYDIDVRGGGTDDIMTSNSNGRLRSDEKDEISSLPNRLHIDTNSVVPMDRD